MDWLAPELRLHHDISILSPSRFHRNIRIRGTQRPLHTQLSGKGRAQANKSTNLYESL